LLEHAIKVTLATMMQNTWVCLKAVSNITVCPYCDSR
jgi:hypothetical protein